MALNIQAVLVASTLGAITVLGMYFYQKKRKNAVPNIWEPIGKVQNLGMYPLKSGHRMDLVTAECTEFGLQTKPVPNTSIRDRCLVVYKEGNKEFKTARTYPTMVLIEVHVNEENYFTINAPGMPTMRVKIPSLNEASKPDEISLWENEKIFTIDCGDEAARWMSNYILSTSSGLRLGFHDGLPLHKRNINKTHQAFIKVYPYLENASMGLYTDLSSFMVMNQSSVDDLAKRIPDSNITIHNFRPNIVVEDKNLGPFVEDNWEWIKIGDVVLRNVKPCARCILTTIDPKTGIRSKNNEPLKTLKTYRKMKDLHQVELEGNDPAMGINMSLKFGGHISVGDTVYLGRN